MSDKTPSQIRNDELDNWRYAVINALCDLADILRNTTREQFPTPDINCTLWSVEEPTDDDTYRTVPVTQELVREVMRNAPGQWFKYAAQDYISYSKAVGDPIRVRFHVNRSTTCERIQTGTKHVEAVPEHDEPVYEWVCNGTELEV